MSKAPKWRGYPVVKKVSSDFILTFICFIVWFIVFLVLTGGLFFGALAFGLILMIPSTMLINKAVAGR